MQFRIVGQMSTPSATGMIAPAGSVLIDAANALEAMARAQSAGWTVLRVEPLDNAPLTDMVDNETGAEGVAKTFDLILFAQELLSLLDAGLKLPEAISTLVRKDARRGQLDVLANLQSRMNEGKRFSDCLEASPHVFPPLFVATVRAAETSGSLPAALKKFVTYAEQFIALRRKVVGALIYPTIVLCVGGAVSLFLIGFVVPRFSAVYESTGRDLPWLSMMLLGFGRWLSQQGWVTLTILVGLLVVAIATIRRRKLRERVVQSILSIPLLARPSKTFRLSRMYRTLALLLEAGIPIAKALPKVRELLLPHERSALDQVERHIATGKSMSEALMETGLSTTIADSLIRTGERTGQLADMFGRAARFHEEELERQIDYASRVIEPLLMAALGLLIGGIVVLLYLPIFDLASSF
jgi:general secretion pathway protein F